MPAGENFLSVRLVYSFEASPRKKAQVQRAKAARLEAAGLKAQGDEYTKQLIVEASNEIQRQSAAARCRADFLPPRRLIHHNAVHSCNARTTHRSHELFRQYSREGNFRTCSVPRIPRTNYSWSRRKFAQNGSNAAPLFPKSTVPNGLSIERKVIE